LKLQEAARMAMEHPVLLALDIDRVMTLSLAPWQRRRKIQSFEMLNHVLGVFRAEPGECADDVRSRMTEEARYAGALLPVLGGRVRAGAVL
jgi:hypothetical protein